MAMARTGGARRSFVMIDQIDVRMTLGEVWV